MMRLKTHNRGKMMKMSHDKQTKNKFLRKTHDETNMKNDEK